MKRTKVCKSLVFVFLMIMACVSISQAQDCDEKKYVKDEKGNTIIEYQSINVGRTPYKEYTTWDWRKKFANNFFKITVKNLSNSDVRFLNVHYKFHKTFTKYCTDNNGKKYVCDKYSEKNVYYSDKITALRVNGKPTNILKPGQMSEKQGATNFSEANFSGKTDTSTVFFIYKGKEYSFVSCRRYR